MSEERLVSRVDSASASAPDLERYASYEDDGDTVVCDRKNPKAWIRSDATAAVER